MSVWLLLIRLEPMLWLPFHLQHSATQLIALQLFSGFGLLGFVCSWRISGVVD
jgi:hypothetical protein